MLTHALSQMMDLFLSSVLMQAYDYQKKGQVLSIRLSDGLLKARVKGTSNHLYDVYLDLKAWPKSSAQCSCCKLYCKHVAASLLELQDKQNTPLDEGLKEKLKLLLSKKESSVKPGLPVVLNPDLHQLSPDELLDEDSIEWFSELKTGQSQFFSYELGILIDGKPVTIVPLIADLILKLKHKHLHDIPDHHFVVLNLDNGKKLRLTMQRIKPLIYFLLQYGQHKINDETALKLKSYQLVLMQETEEALIAKAKRFQTGTHLKEYVQSLINTQDALQGDNTPKGLMTVLRDYQQQGVNWLQFLRHYHLGGILADDMGLGKTVQTLAHLQIEKEQGRLSTTSLIIAPTSLLSNWFEEAKRFTPSLKVLIFHGNLRHQDNFDDYDLILSTYGLIQRDKTPFMAYHFYYLILDEAQFIKNAQTKTTQIIHQIKATHRLCLSGTPLENHLGEIWSLFHFLMPGLLGDAKHFRKFFRVPIEKNGDSLQLTLLLKRIKPFLLRRSKNEVLSELPPKTEMNRIIELEGVQRDVYEAIRMSTEKEIREAIAKAGIGKSHILVLDALLKLRQLCCDPRLLSLPEAKIAHGESAKLNELMLLLDNLVAENRRVLVFSQFTSMLALIEEALLNRQYKYLKLTGKTVNRQQIVNTFQEGNTPIFLISLKAGGTGLNLTKADTVIHYDPWWNPAAEDQATDRSHRIGQENPVFVYKLITKGTVEEAILGLQNKKRLLVDGILSDNNKRTEALSIDDIEALFKPCPPATSS